MKTSASACLDAQKQLDEAATLRTLNAFAIDLIAIPTAEDLFWYVAQNVVARLNFIDCVIYHANADQTELVQIAAIGDKNPFGRSILNPLRIPFGRGITGQVAQTQSAIIIDDLLRDQNYIPDTQPARSEICVPLISRGRVVGVIDSEHPETRAFGDAELEILTTIAAMTSAKLELLEEAERSSQRYLSLAEAHAQLSLETANRKALEAKLHEARRMEAIGRLTGRFAHDFNNLLTVISGNLEFLAEDVDTQESRQSLSDAQSAAKRGAKLIQDMLAFSQRTRLVPALTDLNRLVASACERNRDLVHGASALDLQADLWTVNVDPAATENAFLNLILNARDAMPDGGDLEILTRNIVFDLTNRSGLTSALVPGRYVCLSVGDTGEGIAENNLQRIFDPFFTTKPVGTGVGLGLSMIMGFVQQSGGAVDVTSSPSQGSVFRLYFPAAPAQGNDLLTINH